MHHSIKMKKPIVSFTINSLMIIILHSLKAKFFSPHLHNQWVHKWNRKWIYSPIHYNQHIVLHCKKLDLINKDLK